MPGTDSLEIRHTSGTVPGDARPGWGLPHQQLPAATRRDLSPESFLDEQIRTGRQQIQDKYALQWKEVNRSRRFIGAGKSQRMLRDIDAKAKQEMLQFDQQAQQQMAQIQNIDRLAEQGAITNPEEVKARMTFGADVAKSMYPTPEKEQTIPEQFGKLDVYSHRISQELEWFKEDKPSKLGKRIKSISPLATAISALRGPQKLKRKVKIYDTTIGGWKKATPEEVAKYDMLRQEEKFITQRKSELLGHPSISRRIVQPGTKGGTFDDKITESVKPQRQQRTTTKPKVIRQRNTRTGQERISYDNGATWQTSG